MSLLAPIAPHHRPGATRAIAAAPDTRTPLVVLGGIPGAGKTTALRQLARQRPDILIVDPESLRDAIASRTSARLSYRVYRPLVHAIHACRVVVLLLAGPALIGRPVVVHDPATRPRRRRWMGRLAHKRGWTPLLVVIDVDRAIAIAGQYARGRVVKPRAFDAHWERWRAQRCRLIAEPVEPVESAASGKSRGDAWASTVVTTRAGAVTDLDKAMSTLASEHPDGRSSAGRHH